MTRLLLSASAFADSDNGLLNVYAMVCDSDGQLVPGLNREAFECTLTSASSVGHWQTKKLNNEVFEEIEPGCYRLALHGQPAVDHVASIGLSVRQQVRGSPPGLASIYRTVAQGHVLVELRRRDAA